MVLMMFGTVELVGEDARVLHGGPEWSIRNS